MKNITLMVIAFVLNPMVTAYALPDPESRFYSYSNPELAKKINTINNIDIRVMPSSDTVFLVFDYLHNKEKMNELDDIQRQIEDKIFESISTVLKSSLSFKINKYPEGIKISQINFDDTLLLDIIYDLEIVEGKNFIFSPKKIYAVAIQTNIKFKEGRDNGASFYSIVDFDPKVLIFEKHLDEENLNQYFNETIIDQGFQALDQKKRLQ